MKIKFLTISKKNKVIILSVLGTLFLGLSGFLIWRVTQEDTIAPEDSEAGGGCGPCCNESSGCIDGWKCVETECVTSVECTGPRDTTTCGKLDNSTCNTTCKLYEGGWRCIGTHKCIEEVGEPGAGYCFTERGVKCEYPTVVMSHLDCACKLCDEVSGVCSGYDGDPCEPEGCPEGYVSCGTSVNHEDSSECRKNTSKFCWANHDDCNNPYVVYRYCKPEEQDCGTCDISNLTCPPGWTKTPPSLCAPLPDIVDPDPQNPNNNCPSPQAYSSVYGEGGWVDTWMASKGGISGDGTCEQYNSCKMVTQGFDSCGNLCDEKSIVCYPPVSDTEPEPDPTKISCNVSGCNVDDDCFDDLICNDSGICVNEFCPDQTDCKCECWNECDDNDDCENNLRCMMAGSIKRCVNFNCPTETDCECDKSCWDTCQSDDECPSNLSCEYINSTYGYRCANRSCKTEQDCICDVAKTCWDRCQSDEECPSNLSCEYINSTYGYRCANSSCKMETDCTCDPTLSDCWESCSGTSDCQSPWVCILGKCVNSACPEENDCRCPVIIESECSDGILDISRGEECEEGNPSGSMCTWDVCDPDDCTCPEIPEPCGDGDLDPGEECEEGNPAGVSCTWNECEQSECKCPEPRQETNPDWNIDKSVSGRCGENNGEIYALGSYMIVVKNVGDGEGSLDKVVDQLDSKVEESYINSISGDGVYENNIITWDLQGDDETLDPGESVVFTYSILVPEEGFGTYENVATGYTSENETFNDYEDIDLTCEIPEQPTPSGPAPQTGLFDTVLSKIIAGIILIIIGLSWGNIVKLNYTIRDFISNQRSKTFERKVSKKK